MSFNSSWMKPFFLMHDNEKFIKPGIYPAIISSVRDYGEHVDVTDDYDPNQLLEFCLEINDLIYCDPEDLEGAIEYDASWPFVLRIRYSRDNFKEFVRFIKCIDDCNEIPFYGDIMKLKNARIMVKIELHDITGRLYIRDFLGITSDFRD